jgi:hypothetical protein
LGVVAYYRLGHLFAALIASRSASFRSRAAFQVETLALRHQTRSPSTLREAVETHARGSTLVGIAL